MLAASLVMGCGGKEERKAKYLERGKDYFEEQNFDKARVEFKNVLQIDPKTAEAYYYLGEIEEKEQNWRRAFGSYRKASELDPELTAARVKLGQFYLAQAAALNARDDTAGAANALGLAQEEVNAVLQREPQNPEGLTLQARLWVQEGDTDRAVDQLEQVLAEHPGLNSAVMALASIHENARRLEDAERVFQSGIESSGEPKPLRIQLSQFYIRQEQYDKAEATLRALIDHNPDELSFRLSLASLLAKTDQLDEAEKVLREAIQAAPDDAQRYVLLADFLASRRSKEAAIEELNSFIKKNPDMTELKFALAKLRMEDGQTDEAKQVLEQVIAQEGVEPAGLRARVQLAQILASEDVQSPRIGKLLDEVLEENPRDNAALLMKGKLDLQQENYVDAIGDFRSVLKDQPDSPEVLRLLAAAHLANGDRELARDTMSRAIDANPGDNDLRLSMARLLVQDDKPDEALEQIDEVLKRDQYHEAALAMKYELLGRKGDVAGMEEVARLMQAGAPEKEEGYIREARLRLVQNDFDAALEIVNNLLDKDPESVPALLTKSDALAAQKKYGEAIEVADKLIEVQPDKPEGYYRKARLLQEQGDIDASLKYYDLAIDKAPQSERVLAEFTEMGISNGKSEEVKARLQNLIESNPDHPSANGLIGLLYANEKEFARAEEAFARQIQITPDQAAPYSRLAQSRLAQGDMEGAIAAFNTGLKALPDNPQLLIGLAGLRERQGDFEAAIALYEKVLEKQPENAVSINNLAALLSDHRTDAASLEKAAELAQKLEKTHQPAFLDTAAWVYYRKGNYDKAMEVLKRVVKEAPQVPVFQYHLGMTYFQKGDKAAAKEHLTQATKGDYQYQGIEEARKTLESL
jgi:tetratricopeptide (TPR) repeat protein